MAVYNPDQVNLAPAYASIINALKSQTEIAANQPPSTLALLAGVAGKAAGAYAGQKIGNKLDVEKQGQMSDIELANQKKLSKFQNKLQMDLDRNRENYKLRGEGKLPLDDAGLAQYFAENGLDPKYRPKIAPGETLWFDPKEAQRKIKHAEFLTEVETAAEKYLDSKDPSEKKTGEFLKIIAAMPEEKMATIADDIRKAIMPDKESMTKGAATLSPVKRQEALRAEFAKKVKEIGFRKYAEAYTVAQSVEKKVADKDISSASDARLLYSWAKMLNPVGVLSDQDFRTAVEIGSYGEQIKRALNKIDQGNVMDDNLRNKIILEIKSSYNQSEANLSQIEDEHRALAEGEGLEYEKTISPVRPKIKEDKQSPETTIKTVIQNGKQYRIEVDKNGKFIREAK